MPTKKILLVTRPLGPPWDEASKNFAYYLAKNVSGVIFGLLTKDHIPGLAPHVIQHPIYTSSSLNLNFWQKIKLLKLVRIRKQYDVLHFMLTPAKLNAFAFKTFLQSPTVKTIQTVATLREDLFSDADFRKILFADQIVTYSDYAKHKLLSLGFSNVTRIYPGIDLDYYQPAPKSLAALRHYGLTTQDFIVIFPGEYTRLGATDDLVSLIIQHAPTLKQNHIKIVFANRLKNEADARKKDAVIAALRQAGALACAIFTDTISDMATLYNLADIVIFPVRNMRGKFDVPLAVIEAMACEKPVIISDIPILREFANADNSVIIETGNTQQLWQAILDLFADANKRTKIGRNARLYAQNNFNIRNVAEKYTQLYQ